MQGSGKIVGGLVIYADNLLLRLKLTNKVEGAEDLLLQDFHIFANVREDGELDEVALVSVALTTGLDLSTSVKDSLKNRPDS